MVPFCTALTVARLLHTRSFSTLLGRVGQRLSASPHPRNALLTAGSCRRRQRHLMATSAPAASGSITPDLLLALAIPPVPGYEFEGARVEHMLAPREGRLSELITEGMALPKVRASPSVPLLSSAAVVCSWCVHRIDVVTGRHLLLPHAPSS